MDPAGISEKAWRIGASGWALHIPVSPAFAYYRGRGYRPEEELPSPRASGPRRRYAAAFCSRMHDEDVTRVCANCAHAALIRLLEGSARGWRNWRTDLSLSRNWRHEAFISVGPGPRSRSPPVRRVKPGVAALMSRTPQAGGGQAVHVSLAEALNAGSGGPLFLSGRVSRPG